MGVSKTQGTLVSVNSLKALRFPLSCACCLQTVEGGQAGPMRVRLEETFPACGECQANQRLSGRRCWTAIIASVVPVLAWCLFYQGFLKWEPEAHLLGTVGIAFLLLLPAL